MLTDKNIILVMGPQGSGKTTQGKLLAENLKYRFVSTGELIRNATPKEVDSAAWDHMKKGDLITDEVVEGLLFPIIADTDISGFILDGYPRSKEQIKHLVAFLESHKYTLSKVFYIFISEQESKKRISQRALIEDRPDESAASLDHRLALYHEKTEPLLAEYKNMGILVHIDGEKSIQEIQDEILTHIYSSK